jgi:hypothetical protein
VHLGQRPWTLRVLVWGLTILLLLLPPITYIIKGGIFYPFLPI